MAASSFVHRFIVTFLAICLVVGQALAGDSERARLYNQWNEKCLHGTVETVDSYILKLQGQLQSNPNDELARAFLGSAFALRAKHGWWGPTKLSNLREGKKHLDEAVNRDPNNARVRLVRAVGFSRVPKKFGVRKTALRDFNQLITTARRGSASGLTVSERQAVFFLGATAWEKEGKDAKGLYRECLALGKDTKYGKQATAALR